MNILIVEDDLLLRKALVLLLTQEGHHVLPAVDGQHALDLVQDNRNIDLVICDLMMPNISVPTFLLMLKRTLGRILPKVIVMSDIREADAFLERIEVKYDYFVDKPVDFFTLKMLVDRISKVQTI